MAVKKNIRTLKLYNLLLKEVSALNRQQPENKKLSLKEVRKYISDKLYPKYKSVPFKKIKKTELRSKITNKLRSSKKKVICDVLTLDPEGYTEGVQYFDIDSFIQSQPTCIYIRVNAGAQFGKTNIFNTRDFNYHLTGVNDITNRINQYVRQQPKRKRNTDRVPMYVGEIQLRPNHPNDGNGENYFLEMILVVDNVEAVTPKELEIPKKKVSKKEQKKVLIVKESKKRASELEPEKSQMKILTKKIEKLIGTWEIQKKNTVLKKKTKAILAEQFYTDAKDKIEETYKQKKITQSQYERLIKRINDAFNKNS